MVQATPKRNLVIPFCSSLNLASWIQYRLAVAGGSVRVSAQPFELHCARLNFRSRGQVCCFGARGERQREQEAEGDRVHVRSAHFRTPITAERERQVAVLTEIGWLEFARPCALASPKFNNPASSNELRLSFHPAPQVTQSFQMISP